MMEALQKIEEENEMPKAIWSDEDLKDMINQHIAGKTPDELANKYGLKNSRVSNLIYRAKQNAKYKVLFEKSGQVDEEQTRDEKFDNIIESVDAGKHNPEPDPEQETDTIEDAANAIDAYTEEKSHQKATPALQKSFKATGEGLIEAVDGMVLIEGQDIVRAISEQLQENFIGTFYGRVEIRFEILPDRDVLSFEVGG